MLDLAQHRCSAAAKNQVGVSVSEHVCEEESETTGYSCEEGLIYSSLDQKRNSMNKELMNSASDGN